MSIELLLQRLAALERRVEKAGQSEKSIILIGIDAIKNELTEQTKNKKISWRLCKYVQ